MDLLKVTAFTDDGRQATTMLYLSTEDGEFRDSFLYAMLGQKWSNVDLYFHNNTDDQ